MSDQEALAISEEIQAQLQRFEGEMKDCHRELAEANASLGRLVDAGTEIDAKLAKLESDLSRIRRHLDSLPDDAIPGRSR